MGLTFDYFYSLTPRQFYNIQKGYSDRREAESNERLILTRRIMYASLMPWSKNLNEQDVWKFDWETNAQIERGEEADKLLAQQLEETEKYWQSIDERRKNNS